MRTYTRSPDGTYAVRSSDGAFVPWNAEEDCPADRDGFAGRTWEDDGSPASLPFVPQPSPPSQQFTFLQFLQLFTQTEQAAIVVSTDLQVKLFLLMATGASFVDLADERTRDGIAYLVSLSLITQARADTILAATAPAA